MFKGHLQGHALRKDALDLVEKPLRKWAMFSLTPVHCHRVSTAGETQCPLRWRLAGLWVQTAGHRCRVRLIKLAAGINYHYEGDIVPAVQSPRMAVECVTGLKDVGEREKFFLRFAQGSTRFSTRWVRALRQEVDG